MRFVPSLFISCLSVLIFTSQLSAQQFIVPAEATKRNVIQITLTITDPDSSGTLSGRDENSQAFNVSYHFDCLHIPPRLPFSLRVVKSLINLLDRNKPRERAGDQAFLYLQTESHAERRTSGQIELQQMEVEASSIKLGSIERLGAHLFKFENSDKCFRTRDLLKYVSGSRSLVITLDAATETVTTVELKVD